MDGTQGGHSVSRELQAGAVTGMPRLILRGEGLALLALATAGYAATGLSWWLYAALFFVPDLSFAAYRAGPRAGALAYNALHSTLGPAVLASLGVALHWPPGPAVPAGLGFATGGTLLLGIAAIWAAHVGFDRALGYGLKYPTGFGDTHLGRIGRQPALDPSGFGDSHLGRTGREPAPDPTASGDGGLGRTGRQPPPVSA